ncbi:MAG: protein kinase [Alphaproteobacteria bacterium]|nr:protein kinase [Alphaproteobacteria bacterium]
MRDDDHHTLFLEGDETLPPSATMAVGSAPGDAERRALEALRGQVEPLALGATLGQGGMGLVRLGVQTRLGREVAVKTLRPGIDPNIGIGLLQEAWVTGALEHPNIVPIYDVSLDAEGLPRIVLKRIEGTSWTDILDDPSLLPEADRADPVAWHLGILVSVCRAIEFAHSRGILHRDLKPDNIMVGRFGEVYLLDWGIAVSLDSRADGRFPLARDQRYPTGTPIYMAPEMALDDGEALCPESDVFLLCGLLFRVLAGRPPRSGSSIGEVLGQVFEPIPIHPDWPEDLRVLLERGLSLDPGARPPASAVREAIELHLRRRGALDLLDRAREGLAGLLALLDRADDVDRIEVYNRFGACRFGLHEVLAHWPEHRGAAADLRTLLERMVRYEIGQRDPRAARVLLADLDAPPPDLEQGIAAIEAAITADRERLAQLAAEADTEAGARTRWVALAGLAFIWGGSPVILPLFGIPPGYPRAMGVAVAQFVATGIVLAVTHRVMMRTRVNRALLSLLLLEPMINFLLLLASLQWDLDVDQATVLELLLATTLVNVGAFLVDRRVLISGMVFVASSIFTILRPDLVRLVATPCIAVMVLNTLWLWKSPAQAD